MIKVHARDFRALTGLPSQRSLPNNNLKFPLTVTLSSTPVLLLFSFSYQAIKSSCHNSTLKSTPWYKPYKKYFKMLCRTMKKHIVTRGDPAYSYTGGGK